MESTTDYTFWVFIIALVVVTALQIRKYFERIRDTTR